MPCRDYEDPAEDMRKMREQNDKLARMLCEVMRLIEDCDVVVTKKVFSPELVQWWKQHKKADERAREQEREEERRQEKIQRALKKLTPKERKLLGLRPRPIKED